MCLWDGAPRADRSDFCSETCQQRYDEWVEAQEQYDDEHPGVVTDPWVEAGRP